MASLRVGFLGAGKMATALAKGWLTAGLVAKEQLLASDPVAEARSHFREVVGIEPGNDNRAVVRGADLLVLAVKPQNVEGLLQEIGPLVESRHLLISIAAGVTLEKMATILAKKLRLVRVMPNTPCLVGASASAYALGSHATPEDGQLVHRLLSSVGLAVATPERLLDAVTGLSGSGPAYVFQMIEALSDGGVRVGLPRDVATKLAAQTLYGAAKLLLETGLHPGVLKDQVASPGGTTIAGLHAMERAGVRAGLMNAVEAATERSRELGK